VKAKIAPSRRRTYSIMANSGFGTMRLFVPMGRHQIEIVVPQSCIRKDTGQLKKQVAKHLVELTRENVIALEKKGVKCYVHPDQRA